MATILSITMPSQLSTPLSNGGEPLSGTELTGEAGIEDSEFSQLVSQAIMEKGGSRKMEEPGKAGRTLVLSVEQKNLPYSGLNLPVQLPVSAAGTAVAMMESADPVDPAAPGVAAEVEPEIIPALPISPAELSKTGGDSLNTQTADAELMSSDNGRSLRERSIRSSTLNMSDIEVRPGQGGDSKSLRSEQADAALRPFIMPSTRAAEAAGFVHEPVRNVSTQEILLAATRNDVGVDGKSQLSPNWTSTLSALPQLESVQASARHQPIVPQIQIPVSDQGWGDEMGDRIVWMVRHELKSAEIRLNPPHLGPVEVRISMQSDQINVSFSSHHASVRDTIEAALPRLREMLGDSGLNLADATVSQQPFSRQRDSNDGATGHAAYISDDRSGSDSATEEDTGDSVSALVSDRLVDYYA